MTTPSSGTISLTNLQSEFGGADPIGFSEYNRGGPYVSGNDNTFSAISTSTTGNRNLAQYYGKTRTEYITTYGLSWYYGNYSPNDTFYGYVDIYRGGKVFIRQQVWCGHNNNWWAVINSGSIKMYYDSTAQTAMGILVLQDPYSNKVLRHDGGSLVLYSNGSPIASTGAPLVW